MASPLEVQQHIGPVDSHDVACHGLDPPEDADIGTPDLPDALLGAAEYERRMDLRISAPSDALALYRRTQSHEPVDRTSRRVLPLGH